MHCPSPETLRRFVDGTLFESPPDLGQHIETCAACQKVLDELPAFPEARTTPWSAGGMVPALPNVPGYEIVRLLGRGGMGEVYQARSQQMPDLVVALKILGPHAVGLPGLRERFRLEAEAMSRLQHPNIVRIYSVGDLETTPHFTMEWLPEGSLADRLQGRPQPFAEAAAHVEQLAEAVQYAHERGIVHRDLKPANVLLERKKGNGAENGQSVPLPPDRWLAEQAPKIADFGLALPLEGVGQLTGTGQLLGTPAYMAPEQASGRRDRLGPTTDVYALGVILYELLTGRPPFTAPTSLELLAQVVERDPIPPRMVQPGIPKDLETICLKSLEKEPKRRYPSAKALAEDLQRFRTLRPIRARRISVLGRVGRWSRRKPALAALTGLSILFLIGSVLIWMGLNRKFRSEQAEERVKALTSASAPAVPYLLESLLPLREEALPLLKGRFQEPEGDYPERLRAACGLAGCGVPPREFLVDAVVRAPDAPGECAVLVEALRTFTEEARPALGKRFDKEKRLAEKARIAIVLLHLGDPDAALRMLAPLPDPGERSAFIHGFSRWHGDLGNLAETIGAVEEEGFRSGLAAALATLDANTLPRESRKPLEGLLAQWHQAEEPGVRAAADLALRRLGMLLPADSGRAREKWFRNSLGTTMIRIVPGKFRMGDTDEDNTLDAVPHWVTLTRPYWLADQEVTVRQFRTFVDDPQWDASQKPVDWDGENRKWSPGGEHPVQQVSWFDAILFCNWLSRKEGRTPCYAQVPGGWRCDFSGTGYRLPTEAEWEFACRAGTTTKYHFGEGEAYLAAYATHSSGYWKRTTPGKTLLPNRWGFFDMHGNVWEWCWDRYDGFPSDDQFDPVGPDRSKGPLDTPLARVVRGGGICNSGGDWRSAARGGDNHHSRFGNLGFRVACGSPPPTP